MAAEGLEPFLDAHGQYVVDGGVGVGFDVTVVIAAHERKATKPHGRFVGVGDGRLQGPGLDVLDVGQVLFGPVHRRLRLVVLLVGGAAGAGLFDLLGKAFGDLDRAAVFDFNHGDGALGVLGFFVFVAVEIFLPAKEKDVGIFFCEFLLLGLDGLVLQFEKLVGVVEVAIFGVVLVGDDDSLVLLQREEGHRGLVHFVVDVVLKGRGGAVGAALDLFQGDLLALGRHGGQDPGHGQADVVFSEGLLDAGLQVLGQLQAQFDVALGLADQPADGLGAVTGRL